MIRLEQLATLKSALQFNRFLLVLFVLLLPFSGKGAEPLRELALFRFAGQVFFLSDLKKTNGSLKILSCLKDQSLLLKFLELGPSALKGGKKDFKPNINNLAPYILLEKLKINAIGPGNNSLTSEERQALSSSCRKLNWAGLDSDEKSILFSEVFLRDRFLFDKKGKEKSFENYRKTLHNQIDHEIMSLAPGPSLQKQIDAKKTQDPTHEP